MADTIDESGLSLIFPLGRHYFFIALVGGDIGNIVYAGSVAVPVDAFFADIEIAVRGFIMADQLLLSTYRQHLELAVGTDLVAAEHETIASTPFIVAFAVALPYGCPVGVEEFLGIDIAYINDGIHILQQLRLRAVLVSDPMETGREPRRETPWHIATGRCIGP